MPRDDATDEGKVQVVGKNRELRVLTTWAWAMRFSGSVKIATRKQAETVRRDLGGEIYLWRLDFEKPRTAFGDSFTTLLLRQM